MRRIVNGVYILFTILVMAICLMPVDGFAKDLSPIGLVSNITPSYSDDYSYYDYVIDEYDIDVVVNENNTFDVTENLIVYFNKPKHGIYRTIPLKNNIIRLDGKKHVNRALVSNVDVNSKYKVSRKNGSYKIKIGSSNKLLTGEKQYTIKYTYNIGEDPVKDYDEFYYNLIGNDWDTVIGNITFTVTMPKDFDSSKLGFSSGSFGSTDSSNINYSIDGNVITGSYDGILKEGESLTIRCELDEGYFVGAGLTIKPLYYLILILPVVFLVLSILLWYKFGRDDKVIKTVEFYPPEGFNSLDVGFMYKGEAVNHDVISLLIYLANKGYIKIIELDEKLLFSKSKGFKIKKLKEYDGSNANERLFLDGLFTKKVSFFGKKKNQNNDVVDEVTFKDLYNNFYLTVNKILLNVNSKVNKNEIFEKSASSKVSLIFVMIIATFCLITLPPFMIFGDHSMSLVALLFPSIGFFTMISILVGGNNKVYVNGSATFSSVFTKVFAVFWGVVFGGVPFVIFILPVLLQSNLFLVGYIIGFICIIFMIICLNYLPKRNAYGNKILGQLYGFKEFLETAEKDKLESMVMDNPTYFYDILPYAYVLGVSDKWIKRFESITLQEPSWYDGPNAFSIVSFNTFINNTMSSAQSAMTSSPSSSSGGGSSGGGSGGGGGGSW